MKPEPKILPLVGGKMLVAPSEPGTAVSGDQTLVSPWGPALSVSMCQEHAHWVCCRDHAVNIVIKTAKDYIQVSIFHISKGKIIVNLSNSAIK